MPTSVVQEGDPTAMKVAATQAGVSAEGPADAPDDAPGDLSVSGPADAPAISLAGESPMGLKLPVSIVILTLNEERNIRDCIESCDWSDDVQVVDSGSSDRTCDIAAELGVKTHAHPFTTFGEQRNWAIDNINAKHPWVFHLDADERFTTELVSEIRSVLARDPSEAGFFVPHKLMFMNKWLRRAEGYPIYQMRLFHVERMRFCDWGHGQREDTTGRVGKLVSPYLHFNFSKGIADWVEKHNRYSTLEASQIFVHERSGRGAEHDGRWFGSELERRRFFKSRIYPKLPARWFGRFIWMYFLKLGFLDGIAGLHYCLLVACYELMTTLKIRELKQGLAVKEGTATARALEPADPALLEVNEKTIADAAETAHVVKKRRDQSIGLDEHERSQWTFPQKLARAMWMLVRAFLFRTSFHNWYGWRRMLLRTFGAKVGRNVRVRPTVKVEIPWNLRLADGCAIGDDAILYSLGEITIGRNVVISQLAHLCAGTHDYRRGDFPLVRLPITVGDGCWIAADTFIGPGVTIGSGTVVGARSSVFKDLPANVVAVGNPAYAIKARLTNDIERSVQEIEAEARSRQPAQGRRHADTTGPLERPPTAVEERDGEPRLANQRHKADRHDQAADRADFLSNGSSP